MSNGQTVLVVSLVANAILVVLLFFKSALNQILLEWWQERKAATKVMTETALEFYTDIYNLAGIANVLILAAWAKAYTRDPGVRNLMEQLWAQNQSSWGDLTQKLLKLVVRLPVDVQSAAQAAVTKIMRILAEQVSSPDQSTFVRDYTEIFNCATAFRSVLRSGILKGLVSDT